MAYKVFSNGNTLPASDLNTYLMNQSVISFASTSARDAAIPAPNEGMLVWLEDSNKYVKYTGSAWADLVDPIPSGNAIINGAFDIWQRATSSTATGYNSADRWAKYHDGSGTATTSQQTFSPGTAPVSGYEGTFFYRIAQAATSGQTYNNFLHKIEDVRTFAGQTVTLSFWAKADAARTLSLYSYQEFGSGGSGTVAGGPFNFTLTTSWVRYTQTFNVASIAGKTIGTNSHFDLSFNLALNTAQTIDIWGVQLEAGSTATSFKRNAPSIQAELAACQRYYFRISSTASTPYLGFGSYVAENASYASMAGYKPPVSMRVGPTSIEYANLQLTIGGGVNYSATPAIGTNNSPDSIDMYISTSGMTQYRSGILRAANSGSAYLAFSAEL